MGFVQQEKIRVPWCFVSNTRSPGWEPPLKWKNLAHVPCSQFHSTSGKSSVPKSSSCKKDFLHLHSANEKTSFYEVLNIYLKYKWPADGWPHHPWHPLRFCSFIPLWRRQLHCLRSTVLMCFYKSHEGHKLQQTSSCWYFLKCLHTARPHHLWQHQVLWCWHETQALQGSSAAPS